MNDFEVTAFEASKDASSETGVPSNLGLPWNSRVGRPAILYTTLLVVLNKTACRNVENRLTK